MGLGQHFERLPWFLPSGNGQVYRLVLKTSAGLGGLLVAPPAVTPSAVGGRLQASSLSLIPRVRCSRLRGALLSTRRNSMSVWTKVSWNRVTPGAVTVLASRQPVASRFLVACRGSTGHSARRDQGEHVALSCLGRYFRGRTASSVPSSSVCHRCGFYQSCTSRFASELTVRRPKFGAP